MPTIPRKVLKVNQRIDISLGKSEDAEWYSSRIEEIADDHIVIAMPMSKGYPVLLQRGENFVARLIADGKVYQFVSTLLHKIAYPLPVWVVSFPRQWEKIQQRAFVRIKTSIPVIITIFQQDTLQFSEALQVLSRDLSGGGVQVVSKQPLAQGTNVQITIELPEAGQITTRGEVVRCEQPRVDRDVYWIGIKFQDMLERDRNKVIKYIFKKQLEHRQKGLNL